MKKARKQKKKAEKKKAKKDRKRKHNRKANTARDTSSCMNDACINNAVKYMDQLRKAVKNFGNQYNRIKRNLNQAGKNDEFEPYLIKLRETGGGNSSNMSCNGEMSEGATNLKKLYDNLEACKTNINNTCHNDNMPAINMTFLDACKATMDGFVNETADAIKASGDQSTAAAA